VALAFIPRIEGKPEVDHIDRNKNNNHVSNLRWADRFEQAQNRDWVLNSRHYWIFFRKSTQKFRLCWRQDNKSREKHFLSKQEAELWALENLAGKDFLQNLNKHLRT
jgi:hypothetical protein